MFEWIEQPPPPIYLNDSKVFVFPPSLKDRKKKEYFIC